MDCSRCGADNPPTDKYCGQCGRPLEEPSDLQKAGEAVGWLVMVSGLIVLALVATYYLSITVGRNWGVGESVYHLIFPLGYPISGQGPLWSGLTVGIILGLLGTVIYAWPRIRVPGASGRGIRAFVFIGSAIVLIGAIFGAFPDIFMRLYSAENGAAMRSMYYFDYQTIVLTGFAIILAGAVWFGWTERPLRLPTAALGNDGVAGKEDTHH